MTSIRCDVLCLWWCVCCLYSFPWTAAPLSQVRTSHSQCYNVPSVLNVIWYQSSAPYMGERLAFVKKRHWLYAEMWSCYISFLLRVINLSIYLCIYLSMYLSIYVSMYLCIYVSMYLCICVCMYVCMYVCIYLSIYLCMYVCMYVCM